MFNNWPDLSTREAIAVHVCAGILLALLYSWATKKRKP